MSERRPVVASICPKCQAAREPETPSGHPVLSTVDDLAHVLAPGMEHPAKCADAAEAMRLVAALTESMAEVELQGRIERNQLKEQLAQLRRRLTWRTGALEILLLGVAAVVTVMWLTDWWPR